MMNKLYVKTSIVTGLMVLMTSVVVAVQPKIDDRAKEVRLETSCLKWSEDLSENAETFDNCFDDSSVLTTWMKNIRKPNKASPLRVSIGAGLFGDQNFRLICAPEDGYTGYTSFVGAGALQSIFEPGSAPVSARNCTHLNFSSFKFVTGYHYINWVGGGESRWSDMELETRAGAWQEGPSNLECSTTRGKHYWYSSRLQFGSTGNRGYTARCDETWFIGSEITLTNEPFLIGQGLAVDSFTLKAEGKGEIHVYGGSIRAIDLKGSSSGTSMIRAENGGKIHLHGNGIDLVPDVNAVGNMSVFYADSGSTIHANNNSYAIGFSIGATSISRIKEDGGLIVAPYNWGALSNPPPLAGSKTGSDIVIETDCSSANCDDSGALPHTLIYDISCNENSGGAWRDTVTTRCRGVEPPSQD